MKTKKLEIDNLNIKNLNQYINDLALEYYKIDMENFGNYTEENYKDFKEIKQELLQCFRKFLELLLFSKVIENENLSSNSYTDVFDATALMQMDRVYDFNSPFTAAVMLTLDDHFKLIINPILIGIVDKTVKAKMLTLEHELWHLLDMHCERARDIKDPKHNLLNFAMDAAINQYLKDTDDWDCITIKDLTKMCDGITNTYFSPNEPFEVYYNQLLDAYNKETENIKNFIQQKKDSVKNKNQKNNDNNQNSNGDNSKENQSSKQNSKGKQSSNNKDSQNQNDNNQSSSGNKDSNSSADQREANDTHNALSGFDPFETHFEEEKTERDVYKKNLLKDFMNSIFENIGMPRGTCKGLFDGALKFYETKPPILNWKKLLKTSIGLLPIPFRKSPLRRNRRQPSRLDLAGELPKYVREVTLAIDTSGSVSDNQIEEFLREVKGILKEYPDTKITLIQCDYNIVNVKSYSLKTLKKEFNVKGRGGTSFTPVFKYMEEHKMKNNILVYFTDGEGEEELECSFKPFRVIWVIAGIYKLSLKDPRGWVRRLDCNDEHE